MHPDCTTLTARDLRDELLRSRDLAQDFDGSGAAALARLVILAAALKVRYPKLARPLANAATKAAYHLAGGLDIRRVGSAFLVPSGTRGGTIHRVVDGSCSCEAGQAGRHCWHVAAVALAEPGRAA